MLRNLIAMSPGNEENMKIECKQIQMQDTVMQERLKNTLAVQSYFRSMRKFTESGRSHLRLFSFK